MPGAFLDSFSWPAKQANPRDGVSNPVGCTKHKKTTVRWFFCLRHPQSRTLFAHLFTDGKQEQLCLHISRFYILLDEMNCFE
jgi:hypothetical protein